jgi:hypothetical protein
VPTDIHPGEHVQEMEGGEADVVVACLAGWRATRNGSRTFTVLCPRKKGAAGDLVDKHA